VVASASGRLWRDQEAWWLQPFLPLIGAGSGGKPVEVQSIIEDELT